MLDAAADVAVVACQFAWDMESSQSTSFFLFDHLK